MHIEHWLALGLLQRVSRTHLPLLGKQTCCLSQPSVFASSSSERVAAQQATISNRLLKCEQKSASAHALSARQERGKAAEWEGRQQANVQWSSQLQTFKAQSQLSAPSAPLQPVPTISHRQLLSYADSFLCGRLRALEPYALPSLTLLILAAAKAKAECACSVGKEAHRRRADSLLSLSV